MRKFLLLLMMFALTVACRDDPTEHSDEKDIDLEGYEAEDTSSNGVNGEIIDEAATERDGVQTTEDDEAQEAEEERQLSEERTSGVRLEGRFKRMEEDGENIDCNCNCVDISFSSPTELCISPDKIYITANYKKTGENSANVFFANMVKSEIPDRDIPWDEFDKDTPIATVTLNPDGTLTLDWLGFAINGEIAVDYAIYGKKTLEGDYNKG